MAAENLMGPLGLVVGAVNPRTPKPPGGVVSRLPGPRNCPLTHRQVPAGLLGRPRPPHLQREVPAQQLWVAQPHCPELEAEVEKGGGLEGQEALTFSPPSLFRALSLGAPQIPRIVYSCPLPETPRTRPAPATQPYLCQGPSPKGALWGQGGLGCNLAVSASWMTWGDPCSLEFLRRGDGSQRPS